MDIALSTITTISVDDKSFVDSAKGTNTTRTIGINPAVGFSSGTHYPEGYLLSGLPLGKINASGLYALYDDTATDGRQTCVGFLWGRVKIAAAGTGVKLGGALLWEGVVKLSRLPVSLDANGQADLTAKFLFVP